MIRINHLNAPPEALRRGAVAIGNFDGVHRGHAALIKRLLRRAKEVRGPAVVFTFDPHPVRILRPENAPPPLTWTDRKAELLGELGVDWVVAYPTDEALLRLPSETFFKQIVVRKLAARAMVEGPNFFFGHNRAGDIELLREYGAKAGVSVEVAPLVAGEDGRIVSSSEIRQAISAGDLKRAGEMLGRPYRIRGMVTHGAARGAKIGFPTANIEAIDTLTPTHGVYAGVAHAAETKHAAAIHIGPSPTFGEHVSKVEVHLLDFDASLYGLPLEVDFLERLREIQPFDSVESLQRQLRQDVSKARSVAGMVTSEETPFE